MLPIATNDYIAYFTSCNNANFLLCKEKKKGNLFNYVIGGIEIVVGVFVARVHPKAGATLIAAGVAMCSKGISSGMDQKTEEDWDREARDRLRDEEELKKTSFFPKQIKPKYSSGLRNVI